MIGHIRVAARVLAMILAFNAGAGRATDTVDPSLVWMGVGVAIGILAMDAGIDVATAAELRRLRRWADRGLDAHDQEVVDRARLVAVRRTMRALFRRRGNPRWN